eukprot:129434_1
MTVDYLMHPWTTLNILPFNDCGICVGFDYDFNKDIITLFGGYNDGHRVCQYNISSDSTQCTQQNTSDIYCDSSSFVLINKNIYVNYAYNGDFLVFNMEQNSFGDAVDQPTGARFACMATDEENIYLIGGNVAPNYFQIFDIKNNIWDNGPPLNEGRYGAACLYNQNNNNIYVFGGDINTIEKSTLISNLTFSLWTYTQSVLTQSMNTHYISAYMPSHSNTIFIIGKQFCNIFFVEQESISLCPDYG